MFFFFFAPIKKWESEANENNKKQLSYNRKKIKISKHRHDTWFSSTQS